MDEWDEGRQVWDELQAVPSYAERFDPRQSVHMVILSFCECCGCWHDEDEGCPQDVEAA